MPFACAPNRRIIPRRLCWLCLLGILLIAASLRFYGLFWGTDLGAHPHPDEEYLAGRIFRVTLQRPIAWAKLLDPDVSTLNPRRFNPETGRYYRLEWGAFLVYVPRVISGFLDIVGFHGLDTFEGFFFVDRVICAICSLLTILLTFGLGSLIFGDIAGLLAAAALTLTVTHIQTSHFMIVDVPLTLFAAATLGASIWFVHRGGRLSAFLMGVAAAGALTCKITGGTLVLALGMAYLLRAGGEQSSGWRTVARYLPWTALGFLLLFGTIEFYALLNPGVYLASFGPLLAMGRGDNDVYFTRQFANTPPYLYQIENLVRWGMGWPLGIASILAVLWAILMPLLWSLRARRWLNTPQTQGIAVMAAWAAPYFLYVGILETKFGRYILPLAPVLCVLAGGFLAELSRYLKERIRLPRWALPLAILVPTLGWALAYLSVYARPHTWLEASRWLYEHTSSGVVVASPTWDQPLPVDIPAEGRRWQEHVSVRVMLDFYADISPEAKLEHLAQGIRQADVIVLPTAREYGTVRRLPWRYPIEIRFFQLLFEERLGYELAYMGVSYPSLGPLQFVDDAAEESFSVYDHPKVLIYRKMNDIPPEELRTLFADALATAPVVSRRGSLPPVELPVPGLDSERVRALLQNSED